MFSFRWTLRPRDRETVAPLEATTGIHDETVTMTPIFSGWRALQTGGREMAPLWTHERMYLPPPLLSQP